ncbi:MAG: LacI family DNA-binding transcriptional regulator [Candidatus Methylomirabilota bacterium]
MPTARDVARRAGVSVATVSAVLNKNKFVSQPLADRVEAAIVELGYRPNLVARSLKSGRTKTLGILIPNIRDPYWAEVVAVIEEVTRREGFRLLLFDTKEDPTVEEESLRLLAENLAEGAIIVPHSSESAPRVARLLERGTAVVLLARRLPDLDADAVVTDNELAGYLGTRHLLGRGYRRIGFLPFPSHASAGEERLRGYVRAVEEAGLPVSLELLPESRESSETSGYDATARLLACPAGRPDAFMASNHLLLVGMLKALRGHGVQVPRDAGVVGFDEYPWTPLMTPPLTVVHQPRPLIGQTAAGRLIQRVRGEVRGPGEVFRIEPTLIVRESCGGQERCSRNGSGDGSRLTTLPEFR